MISGLGRLVNGSEQQAGEALAGQVTHRLQLRFHAGLAPAQRFRFGTRIFEIVAVLDPQERGRFLDCYCRERGL